MTALRMQCQHTAQATAEVRAEDPGGRCEVSVQYVEPQSTSTTV